MIDDDDLKVRLNSYLSLYKIVIGWFKLVIDQFLLEFGNLHLLKNLFF